MVAGLKINVSGRTFPTAGVSHPPAPCTGIAILLIAALLSSCVSAPAIDSCAWVKPIYVSRSDVLTPGTAGQILAHNRSWEQFCKD